jgi:hypothetical protein
MKLTIDITPDQVDALAVLINASVDGAEPRAIHFHHSVQLMTTIVGRAALIHGIKTPAVCEVFARAYDQYAKPRRLPKSHRPGPGARA